jgi:hypothetical protein
VRRNVTAMGKLFEIFRIRTEERLLFIFILVLCLCYNILVLWAFNGSFMLMDGTNKQAIYDLVRISGFDVCSLVEITRWTPLTDLFRHPFLPFFLYPFYLLNQGLIAITGYNCGMLVMVIPLVFLTCYGLLFLFRIFYMIIGVGRKV